MAWLTQTFSGTASRGEDRVRNLSAQQTRNVIPLANVVAARLALLVLLGVGINLYFTRRLAKDRQAFEVSTKEAALKVALHKERVDRFTTLYDVALGLKVLHLGRAPIAHEWCALYTSTHALFLSAPTCPAPGPALSTRRYCPTVH